MAWEVLLYLPESNRVVTSVILLEEAEWDGGYVYKNLAAKNYQETVVILTFHETYH